MAMMQDPLNGSPFTRTPRYYERELRAVGNTDDELMAEEQEQTNVSFPRQHKTKFLVGGILGVAAVICFFWQVKSPAAKGYVADTAGKVNLQAEGTCKRWCADNDHSWETLCGWNGCSACPECSASSEEESGDSSESSEEEAVTASHEVTAYAVNDAGLGGEGEKPPEPPEPSVDGCTPPAGKPNILWMSVDDFNYAGGGPSAKMPNIKKLAASGAEFKAAYGDHPICAPSRASIMSGIRGGVSNFYMGKWGNYKAPLSDDNFWWNNPVLKNSMTIPEFFRSKCYYVAGTGKVNHKEESYAAGCEGCLWDEYYAQPDYGPYAFDGKAEKAHPDIPEALALISNRIDYGWARLSNVPFKDNGGFAGWRYSGAKSKGGPRGTFEYSKDSRSLTSDEYNAVWAIETMKKWETEKKDKPWLLMVGFVKPHTPLHCPDEHFDNFPLEDVELPVGWDEDTSDNYYEGVSDVEKSNGYHLAHALKESYEGGYEEGLKHWMQAYYACVEFVDVQVGKVVDYLEASPHNDNTIVVFVSDNGWQNGAKGYVYKNSPWEEGTKVPLSIKAPGVTTAGTVIDTPVSLTDIYPTLMDLTGYAGENTIKAPPGHALTGTSMKPLLEGKSWDKTASYSQIYPCANKIVLPWPDCNAMQACNHWAMRQNNADGKWRYIIYNDGSEELYNQNDDPNEQNNIITKERGVADKMQAQMKEDLKIRTPVMGQFNKEVEKKCNKWCDTSTKEGPWSEACIEKYKEAEGCPLQWTYALNGGDEPYFLALGDAP